MKTIQTKCRYERGATNLSKCVNDGQIIVMNNDSKNLVKTLTKNVLDFKNSPITTKTLQTKEIIKMI